MKFGKLIQAIIDAALPAWKDKFLHYKLLKKRLNALVREVLEEDINREEFPSASGDADTLLSETELIDVGTAIHEFRNGSGKRGRILEGRGPKRQRLLDAHFKRFMEEEFKGLLEEELIKLNEFVVEKEEEFIIKLQDFKEKVERLRDLIEANANNHMDVINLQKDVVVFHGEMVLLENYSSLNYRGLVKIVKKHDRLTGAWLRLSFIPNVLRQPFYSMEMLSRLVRDCESNLLSVFPSPLGDSADGSFERDTQVAVFQDNSLFHEDEIKNIHTNTMAALQTIRNISRGSSTYNVFSVPPREDDDDSGSVVEEG